MEWEEDKLTHEQWEHLRKLNKRMRELEEDLIEKVWKISQDITKLSDGNETYKEANIEGKIYIRPSGDVSSEFKEKFMCLDFEMWLISSGYGETERSYAEPVQLIRENDRGYVKYPEDYPEDYVFRSKTYDWLIIHNVTSKRITYEEIMLLRPDDIFSKVEINI